MFATRLLLVTNKGLAVWNEETHDIENFFSDALALPQVKTSDGDFICVSYLDDHIHFSLLIFHIETGEICKFKISEFSRYKTELRKNQLEIYQPISGFSFHCSLDLTNLPAEGSLRYHDCKSPHCLAKSAIDTDSFSHEKTLFQSADGKTVHSKRYEVFVCVKNKTVPLDFYGTHIIHINQARPKEELNIYGRDGVKGSIAWYKTTDDQTLIHKQSKPYLRGNTFCLSRTGTIFYATKNSFGSLDEKWLVETTLKVFDSSIHIEKIVEIPDRKEDTKKCHELLTPYLFVRELVELVIEYLRYFTPQHFVSF